MKEDLHWWMLYAGNSGSALCGEGRKEKTRHAMRVGKDGPKAARQFLHVLWTQEKVSENTGLQLTDVAPPSSSVPMAFLSLNRGSFEFLQKPFHTWK